MPGARKQLDYRAMVCLTRASEASLSPRCLQVGNPSKRCGNTTPPARVRTPCPLWLDDLCNQPHLGSFGDLAGVADGHEAHTLWKNRGLPGKKRSRYLRNCRIDHDTPSREESNLRPRSRRSLWGYNLPRLASVHGNGNVLALESKTRKQHPLPVCLVEQIHERTVDLEYCRPNSLDLQVGQLPSS